MNVAVASVLPATAVAAPTIIGPHPDAELIALGVEFDAARAANKKNDRRRKRANKKYERERPPMPEACRWIASDADVGFPDKPERRTDGYYAFNQVDLLRDLPDVIEQQVCERHVISGFDKVFAFRTEMIPGNQKRAAEIVEAFDKWQAEDMALQRRLGIEEEDPETVRLWNLQLEIERKISKTPAHTIEGLHVKARVALAMDEIAYSDDGNDCECVLARLAEDVTRIAKSACA